MEVDVVTQITIDRPRSRVAAFVVHPDNATAWYRNIKSVEWRSPKPLQVGSRVAFVAHFLGRRLAYTYTVREWVPGERLVMSTDDGPFAMETTYSWADEGTATRMTLRNRGRPTGFTRFTAPAVSLAMRQANRADLRRLKRLLEADR